MSVSVSTTDFNDNSEAILYLLKQNNKPMLQRDIREKLNIDSGRCSRAMRRMEKDGVIRRIQIKRTFKIMLSDWQECKDSPRGVKNKYNFTMPPCFGCNIGCDRPDKCVSLDIWIFQKSKRKIH